MDTTDIPGRVWTAKIKFKLLFHWGAPPPQTPVIVGLEASVIDWEGHLPQQKQKCNFLFAAETKDPGNVPFDTRVSEVVSKMNISWKCSF